MIQIPKLEKSSDEVEPNLDFERLVNIWVGRSETSWQSILVRNKMNLICMETLWIRIN